MKHRLIFYVIAFWLLPVIVVAQSQPGDSAVQVSKAVPGVAKDSVLATVFTVVKSADTAMGSSVTEVVKKDTIVVVHSLATTASVQVDTMAKVSSAVEPVKTDTSVVPAPVMTHHDSIAQPVASHAAIDTELVQGRIMLTDATLDLNRALLQGVQASLDSFNVKRKGVIDDKNIQATIHNMQRQRDKVLLTPYLLHMQDSLRNEIKKEENEKATLEAMIYGTVPRPAPVVTDNIVRDTATYKHNPDTTIASVAVHDTPTGLVTAAVTPPVATAPVKHNKKPKKQTAVEPVVSPVTAPDTIAATSQHVVPVTFDSLHIRPVIEAGSSDQALADSKPVMHWETARAIYEVEDTSADRVMHEATDTQSLQNSRDSAAYVPVVSKSAEPQQVMSDSLRHIKAQLYWTRATKAGNDRSYKTAAEDLKKAIDLLPGYYDAWYSLGEVDAHLGFYSKALNEFRTCAGIDSSKAALFCKMGNIELKLRRPVDAEYDFNRSLMLDFNYVQAIMGEASIDVDKKLYESAIKQYARVLEIDRGYHVAYKAKAMAEYQLKRYDAAIDDFTRFLIFDESDASVYYYRGLSKIDLSQQMDGCADLAFSAKLGHQAALKAMETHCK